MVVSNIWQLRRQPAKSSWAGKLLWWLLAPGRLIKSLGTDVARRRYTGRLVGFSPATTSLSDVGLAARLLAAGGRSLREGAHIAEFEGAFAQYLGVDQAVSFGKGRAALAAILKAMEIGPGDEIILPAYTCLVVPQAICYAGVQPVFADIDQDTYNFTAETIAPKISSRTKAILVQHTFGSPVELEPVLQLAREKRLKVIEDCATALGATYNGRKVGAWGDAALFSFDQSKLLSTEEGGMAVAMDPAVLERLKTIQAEYPFPSAKSIKRLLAQTVARKLFLSPSTRWWGHMAHTLSAEWFEFTPETMAAMVNDAQPPAEYHTRLSNAQAQLGLNQLKVLEKNLAVRQSIGQQYQQRIQTWPLSPVRAVKGAGRIYPNYPTFFERRNELVKFAAERQIELGIFFAAVIHPPSTPLDRYGYRKGSCPVAEKVARSTIQLPTQPLLTQDDINRIITVVDDFSQTAMARN